MIIRLSTCEVRSFRAADADSLARHANNRKIWINLRDRFPHPYSIEHAREFIAATLIQQPETHFALVIDGEAAGAIGFGLNADVERVSAEVGYWIGEAHWGKGIASEVLVAMTPWAVRAYQLTRIYALPFEYNRASIRVLEKAGYAMEARLRRSAIKDGNVVNQLLYGYIAPEQGK